MKISHCALASVCMCAQCCLSVHKGQCLPPLLCMSCNHHLVQVACCIISHTWRSYSTLPGDVYLWTIGFIHETPFFQMTVLLHSVNFCIKSCFICVRFVYETHFFLFQPKDCAPASAQLLYPVLFCWEQANPFCQRCNISTKYILYKCQCIHRNTVPTHHTVHYVFVHNTFCTKTIV